MALLMICSQLLLTGFVIYWLNAQYRDAQLRLQGELKREYLGVQDQFIDSMLMMHLIIPSLEDSLTVEVIIKDNTPQLIHPSQGKVPGALSDSAPTVVMMKHFSAEIPDDERMVRSVRLFINENKEVFQNDGGMHVFAMNQDSIALFERMNEILEAKALNLSLYWPDVEPESKEIRGKHGIILSGGPARLLPDLMVKGFRATLLAAIFPQLLFGLILLLLSASALWFSFRSLKKQLALHQLRDDFIANISHELKTPVSTVKITLEALRKYDLRKDAGRADEYLEMASHEMERLELLIGKVLQHDMLRNPSLVMEKTAHDLGTLVQSVLSTLEIPIRESGAEISLSLEEGESLVNIDPIYVEGVLVNLIDNCLKYAGPLPQIELKLSRERSGTSLAVKDQGPGIPEPYKKQVFEKFFRVPSGHRHDVKGYGLGLNFVSQVMTKHGGSVSLESSPGKGSIFTLHFPNLKV